MYEKKFGVKPKRRPFFSVLGDADVVGGLYRNPYKIHIPIDHFASEDLTFMCPDHAHLISYMKRAKGRIAFGYQLPDDYTESKYPYFGKLMTYDELIDGFKELKIDQHLERQHKHNGWYRYVESHIWCDPETILKKNFTPLEVIPEPWTMGDVTYLQNYKLL